MQDIKKDSYANKSGLSDFSSSRTGHAANIICGRAQPKSPLQKLKDKYSNDYPTNPLKPSVSNKSIIKSKPPKISVTSNHYNSKNKKARPLNEDSTDIGTRATLNEPSYQNDGNTDNSSTFSQPKITSTLNKPQAKRAVPTLVDVGGYTSPVQEPTVSSMSGNSLTSERSHPTNVIKPEIGKKSSDASSFESTENITHNYFQNGLAGDMEKAKQKLEKELNRNPRVRLKTKKQAFNFTKDFPSTQIYNEDYSLDKNGVYNSIKITPKEYNFSGDYGEESLRYSNQQEASPHYRKRSNHTSAAARDSWNGDYLNQVNSYPESSREFENPLEPSGSYIKPPEAPPGKSFLFKNNPNSYNFRRTEPFKNNSEPTKKRRINVVKKGLYTLSLIMLPVILVGGISYYFLSKSVNEQTDSNNLAVAGQQESIKEKSVEKTKEDLQEEYLQWSMEVFGKETPLKQDEDKDGLNNYEEFLLQTDPQQVSTCNNGVSDIQNFLNLTNPATCEPINLDDKNQLNKYNRLIQKTAIEFEVLNLLPTQNEAGETVYYIEQSNSPVLEIFGVDNYQAVDTISVNSNFTEKQLDYLNSIKKIEAYITKTRSYDSYNKEYLNPVHPAVYLETSLKYEIPLSDLLSLAQLDSQFGTARFTNSGTETNTHLTQNVFSTGLENSNHRIMFKDWNDSLAAIGNWYKFYEEKGIDNCQKWELYRPDENFCNVVNQNSKEIEEFMGQ